MQNNSKTKEQLLKEIDQLRDKIAKQTGKQAEESLIKQQKISEKILETSSALIIGLDKDHLIRIFNTGAENITGYKKKDVIGEDWFNIFIPDEMLNEMNKVWKNAWGISSHSYVNSIIVKTGEEKIISWQITGIYEGEDDEDHLLISIGEDITKRKQVEAVQRKSEEQYRLITENTGDVITLNTFDLKASYTYVSPSIKTIAGYEPEDLLGRSCFDFIHPEDKKKLLFPILKKYVNLKIRKLLTGIESDINETIEYRFKKKSGEWVYSESTGNIVRNQLLFISRDITERKRSDEAVQESEQNLRDLVENLMDGVAIADENSKHIYVNSRFCEITGYSKNELLNMTGWDLTRPEDRAKFKQRMKDRMAGKKIDQHYEHIILKKDGTEIPVEMSTTVTTWQGKKRPMAIIHDITEQKRTEEALLESELQLQTLIDAMPDFVCFKDVDGRWLKANHASIRVFNLKGIDYLGKNDSELLELNSELRDTFLTCKETDARALMEGGLIHGEEKVPDSDGSVRFFDVIKVPVFHSDDERKGIVVIGHDITERKKTEEELVKHQKRLEETVKQRTVDIESQSRKLEESQRALTFLLEDVNDARNELEETNLQLKTASKDMESFTYSVSHDLRAPLRAILGFSNKFTDSYENKVDEEGKRLLNVINENTKKMGMLIDDLLDFSRMGRAEMRKVKVDIKGLVHETWNEQKNQFADRKIELTIKDLPIANGDRNMLRQVLFNLLSNAAKFSKNKEVSRIEVGAKAGDSEIVYYVKDNGAGFDMKYIDKLFQVFQRLHSEREFEGTGVGLAIVHRVINRHGGKVWAKSTLNRGATIYFSLPK